jgi:hypothetical protein
MAFPLLIYFNDENFNDDREEIPGVVNMDFVASGEHWIIFDFDLISNPMFQLSCVPWVAIYESKDHWTYRFPLLFSQHSINFRVFCSSLYSIYFVL